MIVVFQCTHLLEPGQLCALSDLKLTSSDVDFKTPLQPPAGEVGSVQALLVSGRGSNKNLGMNLPLLCFGCLTLPFLS